MQAPQSSPMFSILSKIFVLVWGLVPLQCDRVDIVRLSIRARKVWTCVDRCVLPDRNGSRLSSRSWGSLFSGQS